MWIEIRHVDSVLLASLRLELSRKAHDLVWCGPSLLHFLSLIFSVERFSQISSFVNIFLLPGLHQHRFQDGQKEDQPLSDSEGSAKESY
jgi:hypothetical protein